MSSDQTDLPARVATRSNLLGLFVGPVIVSAATLVSVLITLDPASSRPHLPQGPGITLDESFNVQMGVYLVQSLKSYGLAILHPQSVDEVFGNPGYNPDHPPLGRLWLGVFHEISRAVAPVESGDNPFVTIHARSGSAFAFALTVLLIGMFASVRWSRLAGVTSSASLAVMPRLFGHAHLAALETSMGLAWTAAILGTIHFWTRASERNSDSIESASAEPQHELPGNRIAVLGGFLVGLALLTKIQAVLLPPLIATWAFWHWRRRAVRPVLICCCTASAVFIAGWPWLWLDLPGHLAEYFGRTAGRVSLNVWYLGQVFKDIDVPWHYPWLMTLVTVPIGILLLAAVGLWRGRRSLLIDPTMSLIIGSVISPLILFSLPGVAVYDGARLFLVAFPGIALLAGYGAVSIQAWQPNFKLPVAAMITLMLTAQVAGILKTTPYYLSYYNAAIGGTAGAERLGFERTYWGDSFSREFLLKLKSTATRKTGGTSVVQVAPILHQFQLEDLKRQAFFAINAAIYQPGLQLIPAQDLLSPLPSDKIGGNENIPDIAMQHLAVFHRQADAPSARALELAGWELIDSTTCQGVIVASLWRRGGPASRR